MRLFVDNLTNVDFSYLHPIRGVVGETWLANVELIGGLNSQGMVCDFGIVKKQIRQWLDEEIDHRLVVPSLSSQLCIANNEKQIDINWKYANKKNLRCNSPAESIALVETTEITQDSIAQWVIQQLTPLFPNSVATLSIDFVEEKIETPFYHYSHGLKKHAGNCQRIAHGHRSQIQIWRNEKLSLNDMQRWADNFKDIYIGTRSDITGESASAYHFAYTTNQGEFRLDIPREDCYLIETDSTVEFIAQHIAQTLKKEMPTDTFRVKAFEGMGKGAIAES